MKKLFTAICLVLSVILLSGCTLPFLNSGNEKVTLQYWGLWEPQAVIQPIIADYQKLHPNVTIQYKKMSSTGYRETVTARLAEGVGPDIFRFHNTWLPMLKNELAPVPDKTLTTAQLDSSYYPVVKRDLKIGQQYYGLPLEIDTLGLYINSDILKAAGATPPKSWEEFKTLAQNLTVRDNSGKILTAGAAIGTTGNVEHWSDILGLMMVQNGTDMTKVGSTVLSDNSNAGVDALNYYVSFAKGDNRVWDDTLDNSMSAFSQGKLAMFFGPHWEAFDIKTINPSLNFVVVPVPQLSGTNITWATYWIEGVARRSKNQAAAWDFLKFLSSKDELKKFYSQASTLRLFGEPYPYTDMASLIKDDPVAGAFVQQAPTAVSWFVSSRTFDNGLNDKMIAYFNDAVNGVYKDTMTAKSALDTVEKGVATLLTQYGLSSGAAVPTR